MRTRTDKLPSTCPKCGTGTTWLSPSLRRGAFGEYLHMRCRCGYDMTAPTNDAPTEEPTR